MAYQDLLLLQTLNAGDILTAATMTQVRNNDETLIDPPACSVYNSASQSIANAIDTALTAASENFDNDSLHSTTSNTSRVTIQTAGRYLVLSSVAFDASAAARLLTRFKVNGVTLYSTDSRKAIGGATPDQVSITRTFVFAAGDYIETIVNQNSGGALGVTLQEMAAVRVTR